MKTRVAGPFAAQLKGLREAAGFTQEELATIAGLSVHAVSSLERGQRRRPHLDTVRALAVALELTGDARDALFESARTATSDTVVDELTDALLPRGPTDLIGRDDEMQTLQRWMARQSLRLITLTGPGGSGKTRLALELAHTVVADGATRVVHVPLGAIRDPSFVALGIAEAIGLSDVTAPELPARARMACGERPTLFVLDNFEHVLEAAPLAAELLTSIPSLKLLVTSRAPLRVRGEREFAVGPLALNAPESGELDRVPAVRLFIERVRDVQPDFILSRENSDTVKAICQKLDALPLALELAAPWMKTLTADELLRRLDRNVLLSPVGARDLPERQQTMSATIAWSYQLLGPKEQRTFRRLGVLRGRFRIEAAIAVLADLQGSPATSADTLSGVADLIDKSLLLRAETSSASRPRYQMLETVRAYASNELATSGERDASLEGLAAYCAREAEGARTGLVGPSQVEWLDRVRDDLENYRATLDWLIERGRASDAADITWNLLFFWLIRARGTEALQWCQRVLSLPRVSPAAEAKALVGGSVMWYTQGQVAHAREWLTRALSLGPGVAADVIAMAEILFGHVEQAGGNQEAARERFTRSMELFRTISSAWGIGNALMGMASVSLASGDIVTAERVLDEATAALRPAGPWFLNLPLYIRANLAVQRGNADAAIEYVRESLTCSRALHDKFAFVYALTPLAAAAALKGDDTWAARVLGTRDAVTEQTGASAVDKSVRELRERTERDIRGRLGEDRWARAYAAGRRASIDVLLKDIDDAHATKEMT
ncbi:MAG TPA: helix-turn-helix domain-containing protein [Vicinamibacterales bacterium]